MEASQNTESRVIPLRDAPDAIELDTADLLSRLESQAEENGRLAEKVSALERVARAERDSRRRLTETLKHERRAAEALHEHAQRVEGELAAKTEEAAELEESLRLSDQQKLAAWMQLAEAERELAFERRPLWRKALRRPPKQLR